jgi:hypothetical protein
MIRTNNTFLQLNNRKIESVLYELEKHQMQNTGNLDQTVVISLLKSLVYEVQKLQLQVDQK